MDAQGTPVSLLIAIHPSTPEFRELTITKMRSSTFSILAYAFTLYFSLVPACEDECMSAITNVFNGNYTIPVHFTLADLADQIDAQFFTSGPPSPPVDYLQPLLSAYDKQKSAVLRKAIFPSFFHGKCQDPTTNINPAGCPNPDCHVVCGTPGSMVHFYPKLRFIAFNSTWHLLRDLTRTGSTVFKQVQRNIDNAQKASAVGHPTGRSLPLGVTMGANLIGSREIGESGVLGSLRLRSTWPRPFSGRVAADAGPTRERRDAHATNTLEAIFQRTRFSLEKICGGSGTGKLNGLPYCSWEEQMKKYILTFP